MAKKKFTPAELVIDLFGIRPLAADLAAETGGTCSPTTVLRWRDRDGGEVPGRWHKPLLALAKQRRTRLTAEELLYGR